MKSERAHAIDHLAELYARLGYLAVLDERHGLNRGRIREHAALTWAIDLAEERYPGICDEARALADSINRYRARQREARS